MASKTQTTGRYVAVDSVEVRIWGKRVGAVAREPTKGYYAFEFDPAFLLAGIDLAPMQMPLAEARRVGAFVFPGLPVDTYHGLPAMLADSLPDKFGNALINAWMAERGVGADRITVLDRLAYMSRRAMGALEFKPARGPARSSATALKLTSLVEKARQAVKGELDSDDHARAALAQIISVGTSAGGARAKAVVAWNPQTDELRAGQFDVEPGFEHWLLKFDGVGEDQALGTPRGYGRIEYAYYLMAEAAGVKMTQCRLLEENGRAHFMTKRFDRNGNERIHVQSLCAMAHLDFNQKATHSYNQLLDTCVKLGLERAQLEQAFTMMVFNVMAANHDDHTKNFSYLLPEGGSWRLAPAYDVTHAYNPTGEWTDQHQMSVNGKFKAINRADVMQVAERFGLESAAPRIIQRVATALDRWHEFAAQAGVDPTGIQAVRANIQLASAQIKQPD
jgi:serine/threonine-protein kinase HipA